MWGYAVLQLSQEETACACVRVHKYPNYTDIVTGIFLMLQGHSSTTWPHMLFTVYSVYICIHLQWMQENYMTDI